MGSATSQTRAREFPLWVRPLAEQMRRDRQRVVEFARSAPADFWARPAPNDGWTNKDLLAHIGRGNDQIVEQLLKTVIAGNRIDTAIFAIDNDTANADAVSARRDWPLAQIIAELEESGEEMQDLLAQLTVEHEQLTQAEPPFDLPGFLRLVERERHDLEHLEQLRSSLEAWR